MALIHFPIFTLLEYMAQGCIQKMELGGAKRDSLKFRGGKGYHVSMAYGGGSGGSSQRRGLKCITLLKSRGGRGTPLNAALYGPGGALFRTVFP